MSTIWAAFLYDATEAHIAVLCFTCVLSLSEIFQYNKINQSFYLAHMMQFLVSSAQSRLPKTPWQQILRFTGNKTNVQITQRERERERVNHDNGVKLGGGRGGGRLFKAIGRFDLSSYLTCGKSRDSSSLYNLKSLCKGNGRESRLPLSCDQLMHSSSLEHVWQRDIRFGVERKGRLMVPSWLSLGITASWEKRGGSSV